MNNMNVQRIVHKIVDDTIEIKSSNEDVINKNSSANGQDIDVYSDVGNSSGRRDLSISNQMSLLMVALSDSNEMIIKMCAEKQPYYDNLSTKINRLNGVLGALGQVVGAAKGNDNVNPSLEKNFKDIISNTSGGKVIYNRRDKDQDKFKINEEFINQLYDDLLNHQPAPVPDNMARLARNEGDFKNHLKHFLMGNNPDGQQKYFSIDELSTFLQSDALKFKCIFNPSNPFSDSMLITPYLKEFIKDYFSKYNSNYAIGYSVSQEVASKHPDLADKVFSTQAELWSHCTTHNIQIGPVDTYVSHYADSKNISQEDYDPSNYTEENCYFKVPIDFIDKSILESGLYLIIHDDKTNKDEAYIRFDAINLLFQSIVDDIVALFSPELAKTLDDVSKQVNSSTADAFPTLMNTISPVQSRINSARESNAQTMAQALSAINQFLQYIKDIINKQL